MITKVNFLQKFYRYHEMIKEKEVEKSKSSGVDVNARPPYFRIFRQCFPQLFNVFFVFFVTLAVFPAVHSDIKMVGDDFIIPNKYFVSVTCFLTFNLCAMLGSLITSWINWVSFVFFLITPRPFFYSFRWDS